MPQSFPPWENFHLWHVTVQSDEGQRSDCQAMFTLLFSPCVLPQQTLKMYSSLQLKGENTLLGSFTPAQLIAQLFPSPFLMKANPTRWTLNLSVEKRRRKVLREDAGQVITLSSSPLLCSLWQKGLSGDFGVTSIPSLQAGVIFAPVDPESALANEVCRILRRV